MVLFIFHFIAFHIAKSKLMKITKKKYKIETSGGSIIDENDSSFLARVLLAGLQLCKIYNVYVNSLQLFCVYTQLMQFSH
jgi:hypothetical protein